MTLRRVSIAMKKGWRLEVAGWEVVVGREFVGTKGTDWPLACIST
jgi:hypothetical protein